MPHADVAFVYVEVALSKLSWFHANSELVIALERSALGAIGAKRLHRHTNRNTGAAVIAARAIEVRAAAAKTLVR